MKILIACEESQAVCVAFRERGHEAYSADIQDCSGGHPEWHIKGDVMQVLNDGWDMMIAHPPCTYLSRAANRVWNNPGRAELREEAMQFFMNMVNAPIPKICVENPVGYPNTVYRKPDQVIHPYFFGDPFLKRTCLWLKGLQPLWFWKNDDLFGNKTMTEYPKPLYTYQRADGKMKNAHFTEAKHGSKTRSKTFPSIATAMAEQWG